MRILAAFIAVLTILSCQSKQKVFQPMTNATPEMAAFEKEFFAELWPTHPNWAVRVGLHEYDAGLILPDKASRDQERAFLKKYQEKIAALPMEKLNSLERMDVALIKNFIERSLWDLNTFKSYEWDPAETNMGSMIGGVLEGTTKSENEKFLALSEKLAKGPAYYEVGFKNLKTPVKELTEFAIKQNNGLVSYLEGEVKSRLEKTSLQAEHKKVAGERLSATVEAVKKYVANLENILKTRKNFRSFRLGKKLYAQKFDFELQANATAEQMYKKALVAKKEAHTRMMKITTDLWPKYFPGGQVPPPSLKAVRKMIDRLADNHVKSEDFLPTIKNHIPELWKFVVEKDLLTMDPKKPLKVRETPEYEQGFAGASVNSPGPFDSARETYYNVTPPDKLKPEERESWLREYNHYILQILNIHEAIPGHYAQLVYANKSPSLIKWVFGNGTMIEGWAVYSETMMLENGYGNQEPEMWLMYDKWRLRVISNTILDYSLHNLNMSQKQAMKLMMDEAFQEKTEAEKKWLRATYSQVQLASYFAGYSEIYEFREELKKKMGDKFNLKQFHEKFLSYGSSPVKAIKAEMLKDMK